TRGFNAIWVIATDQLDQNNAPFDALGNIPFTGCTVAHCSQWFSGAPVSAYWTRVDSIVSQARALGITVFLMPSFVGNADSSGAYDTPNYASSSTATLTSYGNFIGARYAGANNIVYLLGGDYNANDGSVGPKVNALASGIAASDANHIITLEACR